MLRDSESLNWSDIIAKVNANVESLSPSTARKLTNTVVFVTIDEKAAHAPLLPCSHFGHFTIGKYRIHGGMPHAGGVTYTGAGICQPPSGIPAQTDRYIFYHSVAQRPTLGCLPTTAGSGSSPRDSGRYSWTAFTAPCHSVRADAVDPLGLARIGSTRGRLPPRCRDILPTCKNGIRNRNSRWSLPMMSDASPISVASTTLPCPNPLLGLTSRHFAWVAAGVYTANGIRVHMLPEDSTTYISTPELSFAIRHLHATAGLNISASHNHPDDNGGKFYNDRGGQEVPPHDAVMAKKVEHVEGVQILAPGDAKATGLITWIAADIHDAYVAPECGTVSATHGSASTCSVHTTPRYCRYDSRGSLAAGRISRCTWSRRKPPMMGPFRQCHFAPRIPKSQTPCNRASH